MIPNYPDTTLMRPACQRGWILCLLIIGSAPWLHRAPVSFRSEVPADQDATSHGRSTFLFSSKLSIIAPFSMVKPISSSPLSKQCLAESINVKGNFLAIRTTNLLIFEVNLEHGVGTLVGIFHQQIQLILGYLDGQNSVLEAIVEENICKTGRDYTADAEIQQCPWRVLARGATAEILARDNNLCRPIGWFVEHEVRIFAAGLVLPHFSKSMFAKARPLDRLQIVLRDDHVGVDIHDIHWRCDAGSLVNVSIVSPFFSSAGRGHQSDDQQPLLLLPSGLTR